MSHLLLQSLKEIKVLLRSLFLSREYNSHQRGNARESKMPHETSFLSFSHTRASSCSGFSFWPDPAWRHFGPPRTIPSQPASQPVSEPSGQLASLPSQPSQPASQKASRPATASQPDTQSGQVGQQVSRQAWACGAAHLVWGRR